MITKTVKNANISRCRHSQQMKKKKQLLMNGDGFGLSGIPEIAFQPLFET